MGVALVFLVGACMTIIYLLRVFKMVFLGDAQRPAAEGSPIMVTCVAVLAALALASGLLVGAPSTFAQAAVKQMLGMRHERHHPPYPDLPAGGRRPHRVCWRAGRPRRSRRPSRCWRRWPRSSWRRGCSAQNLAYTHDWAGFGMEFSLRLAHFSGFILLAVAGFSLLVALYSWKFMRDRAHRSQYYAYMLVTLAMTSGAVLADQFVMLLFFWEGLLLTLFGMVAIGRPDAWKTALKAFIIVGVSDVCLMVGMALAAYLAGTISLSAIAAKPLAPEGLGGLAMVLMIIGAISKAGSMPFHSWIPDAAVDAPLPFMAFLPASLEKLLGIYLLARITLDLFALTTGSWISLLLMIVGCVTILLAVVMALVQKDYKRLLSYHAISQVGYMILGIGTCLPVGIVGGLFHMINHAMYKTACS